MSFPFINFQINKKTNNISSFSIQDCIFIIIFLLTITTFPFNAMYCFLCLQKTLFLYLLHFFVYCGLNFSFHLIFLGLAFKKENTIYLEKII